MLWNKQELLDALSGELLEHNLSNDITIDEVVIDSRKITKNGLFIAIKGEKNDGHDYLEQVAANGCKIAIIEKKLTPYPLPLTTILVKNTFVALYKLAEFSRQRSSAKIIAVTGSVGKTSTKEMLKLAFSAYGKTFATPGNLNNHFGLPLCLANFSKDCEFGIFEMGMNHLNEIDPLSKLARPHLAIITTVGPVHIEFFKNEEEIALAKSEIFSGLVAGGTALINRDNSHFDFLKNRAEILGKEVRSFGLNNTSDYRLEKSQIKEVNLSEIELSNSVSYQISSSNKTAIFNSVIVAAALDLITKDSKKGLAELLKLENGAGRGKITEISIDNKNITIIDDSYNASLPSIKAGIEYAVELKNALKKNHVVAALGDMLELGEKSVELHEKAANYLTEFGVEFAVLVGEKMTNAAQNLPKNSYKTFPNSGSASLEIQDLLNDGDILYVKGSRGTKMEKIIEKLTNQTNAH
jgi:UDP-N-acetylmuramoyl-tripeptide--D-alanyl-D-alanine ligase